MNRMLGMLPFLAAVFIDLFSFGLMYPVIVILFRNVAADHSYGPATLNLLLSLTFSLFPLGMFFGASLLGDLSDALGRRRTLLICMTGLGLAYTLMFLGVETRFLALLLIGRLVSGLMAGAAPIAQAAMMDHSRPEERGRDMSRVVLVNCLALASAPAAGGVLTDIWLPLPLLVTMILCGAVFLLIYRAKFAEMPSRSALTFSWRRPMTNFVLAAQHPRIRWLALAFFLFQFGFAIYYVYVIVLMGNVYRLEPSYLGLFSATLGVGFVVGSTLFYRILAKLIPNEVRACGLSLVLCGVFVLFSAGAGEIWQWPIVFLAAVTNCACYIALLSLISGAASTDSQGWAMGIGSAAVALAFFLSGLIANALAVIPLPAILALGGIVVVASALPLLLLRQPMSRAESI
ncbi:MFS transporter [Acidisoma cellulosilytica]|uniref:MFS transporter n=1 Tax=Acidisoma cellulosilyticum TaxID=2802395 RepID=A0A963YYD0_9PROT|nr:MFS transporter [Acidisoma cellulosilyticum]MCB8879235.1 MFS transporter [Acidisoma cellulosilyticum]